MAKTAGKSDEQYLRFDSGKTFQFIGQIPPKWNEHDLLTYIGCLIDIKHSDIDNQMVIDSLSTPEDNHSNIFRACFH